MIFDEFVLLCENGLKKKECKEYYHYLHFTQQKVVAVFFLSLVSVVFSSVFVT